MEILINMVKSKGFPHWILVLPLLHLLRGRVPFERPASVKFDLSWAGLQGLRISASGYEAPNRQERK